jgi:competence protein ComGF
MGTKSKVQELKERELVESIQKEVVGINQMKTQLQSQMKQLVAQIHHIEVIYNIIRIYCEDYNFDDRIDFNADKL